MDDQPVTAECYLGWLIEDMRVWLFIRVWCVFAEECAELGCVCVYMCVWRVG